MTGIAAMTLASTLAASPVHAQGGINLSWVDCGSLGFSARNFACNSNTGSVSLVSSAIAPVPLPQLNGVIGVIDLQTSTASLNPWWHLESGGCRDGSLTASFDFTADFNCVDLWQGAASGSVVYAAPYGAPNRARLQFSCSIPTPVPVNNADEFYAARATIDFARSTGSGACSGCLDGACFLLSDLRLLQPSPLAYYDVCSPLVRQYATYQTAGEVICPGAFIGPGSPGCPGPVEARRSTWGQVKSLYR